MSLGFNSYLYQHSHTYLRAAALATGCRVEITEGGSTFDLRQNNGLSNGFKEVFESQFGAIDYVWGIKSASTDFVSI